MDTITEPQDSESDNFTVRDVRRSNWFWIDRVVIDRHGESIGAYGIAVYAVLVSYANENTGVCFPSLQLISNKTKMSVRSVRTTLRKLEEVGLIHTDIRVDTKGQHSNLYTLLSCPAATASDEQKTPPKGTKSSNPPRQDVPPPPAPGAGTPGRTCRQNEHNVNEHEVNEEKEQQLQRGTRAKPPAAAKEKRSTPEPQTPDSVIVALAAACPRFSTTGPAFGKAVAWCKENNKTPEWIGGFAEWFVSEHEDWENPTPAPCQFIQFSESYDNVLRAAAAEAAERRERRRRNEEITRAMKAEQARKEAEFMAEVERQKAAGTYQEPVYRAVLNAKAGARV